MKKLAKSAVSLLEQLFITMFVISLVFTYIFRVVNVDGESMCNTFADGDRIIINLADRSYKTGDIAVMYPQNAVILDENGSISKGEGIGKVIIKRIIATEGQTVDIDFSAGIVTVDGERLYEDYLDLGLTHYDGGAFTGKYPVTVPRGYVFVMGDNRSVSLDSRSDKIGFVAEDDIIGEAFIRIYPRFEMYP
ncbi:MAG: signal peptidase I [Ruminococcus sp.]|nr:signal peptidase I [Ruminococcus sp.]